MSAGVIGREEELGSLQAFLDESAHGPSALVVSGEPGIGKTSVWQAGVELARADARRVLECRGDEAETALAFTALSDLLAGVVDEALPSLAPPRRLALELALLLDVR